MYAVSHRYCGIAEYGGSAGRFGEELREDGKKLYFILILLYLKFELVVEFVYWSHVARMHYISNILISPFIFP